MHLRCLQLCLLVYLGDSGHDGHAEEDLLEELVQLSAISELVYLLLFTLVYVFTCLFTSS